MKQLQPRLIQELSPLRKGKGIAALRLHNKPTLRTIAARSLAISPDSLTDSQLYIFLTSELSSMGTDHTIIALQNALGISASHDTLSERRRHLSALTAKHPDTIERYENEGISKFAAYLAERDLLAPVNNDTSPVSPLYLRELEAQAQATRTMTVTGLTHHLSLADYGEELMHYLESPRKPYIDTTVHIALLPSSRGSGWYRFRLTYSFCGGRESFRVAVVLNSADGEQLLANGLIDDYHQLHNPTNPERDIKAIIANSKFMIRNSQTNAQKLLRLRALQTKQAEQVLQSASTPLNDSVWLLHIAVPPRWQTEECTYVYQSLLELQIGSYAYWYAPTLMLLQQLSLDFSQFPQVDQWEFSLQPFLGHSPGTVAEKYVYTLHLNNWIMPGHGIMLMWQLKNPLSRE
ncbi:MAG TPA: hypothetical protein VFZ48_01310 [Candidatus Saccharimonadales bacterium]